MSCCGGSHPQRIRKESSGQVEKHAAVPSRVVQKKINRQTVKPASMHRQYVVPRDQCPKCGYTAMIIIISGRERQQCSNANCRFVIQ
jgi:hypothetical protein